MINPVEKGKAEQDKRDQEWWGGDQAAILNSTVTVSSSEKLTFEQILEGVNYPAIREERGTSQCKALRVGPGLGCVKGSVRSRGSEGKSIWK